MLFAWQAQGFRRSIRIKIAETYCNSEAKRRLNMSVIFQASLAEQLQSVNQSDSQSVSQSISQLVS